MGVCRRRRCLTVLLLFPLSYVPAEDNCVETFSRVSGDIISFYHKTSPEDQLKRENLGESYRNGLNATVHRFLPLAQSLRSGSDHNHFFRDSAESLISLARESIVEKFQGDQRKIRLNQWEIIKKEAQSRRIDHRYHTLLGYRLSILTTPEYAVERDAFTPFERHIQESEAWKSHDSLEEALESYDSYERSWYDLSYLNKFLRPHSPVIPLGVTEELGIMPFTRVFLTGVHLLGVNFRESSPYGFFVHDIGHMGLLVEDTVSRKLRESGILSVFHTNFIRRVDRLHGREKEMAEFFYFYLTHEDPVRFKVFMETLFATREKELRELLPDTDRRGIFFDRGPAFEDFDIVTMLTAPEYHEVPLPNWVDDTPASRKAFYREGREVFIRVMLEVKNDSF